MLSSTRAVNLGASPITEYLRRVVNDLRDIQGGAVNSSIPALANADPDPVGIVVATVDGSVYRAGDTDIEFSIQSISKAFTYAQALTDRGQAGVFEKIDVEPSGDAFNEISLQQETGRPANAMINAGAIAAASLVRNTGHATRLERLVKLYSECAGRPLKVNRNVQAQEHKAGDRNRALAWLLTSRDIIEGDPTDALEDYFAQCSVMVTCEDLARMGATLAADGVNPMTGERVLEPWVVSDVLSVMNTCGMYDDAGRWALNVGLPAKSGVSGGIVAVMPGQLAVAVFSPPLDHHGNSVRGVAACQQLTRDLDLHFARMERNGRSTVRAEYNLAETVSLVRRNAAAEAVLEEHGEDVRIIELQADLRFAGAETAIRTVREAAQHAQYVLVDIRQVDDMGRYVVPMLSRVGEQVEAVGGVVALIAEKGDEHTQGLERPMIVFSTRAEAITWAEELLLDRFGDAACQPQMVRGSHGELLSDLSPEDRVSLNSLQRTVQWPAGTTVVRAGQRFTGLYAITSGTVEVSRRSPDGERVELEVLGPGMNFGESALGTDMRHMVSYRTLTDTTAQMLPALAIAELEETDPALAMRWWRSVAKLAMGRIDDAWRQQAGDAQDPDRMRA